MKEVHKQIISEKDQKITSLEMRLKSVQEQYEIVSRDKASTQTRTDR